MGVWNQWNGMVEWTTESNTGMDMDKTFVLIALYMDHVDRY